MALKTEQAPAELGPEYLLLRNWATFALYQQQFLETVYSDRDNYYVFKIK